MKRIASLLLTALVLIAVGIGVDTTPEFDAWKSSTDAKEVAAKSEFDNFPANPCVEGHELTKAFTDWKSAHASKLTDLRTHWVHMPTNVCQEPQPPPGSGLPNIFGRLQFEIVYESALGFSQASDVTYNRRTEKPVIIDQFDRLVFVDLQGVTERAVAIDSSGLPDPRPSKDWEALQWVGQTATADLFVIVYEASPARLYWIEVPFDPPAATVFLIASTEAYILPDIQTETLACDHNSFGVLHSWTYGTADKHIIITRGSPTTHQVNAMYPTHSWLPGFRGAFWDKDYCPNPIKVGCSSSDVTLREINHTDTNVPYGSVVSSSATFTRSNRTFEGGCFLGSEKKICLVAEASASLSSFFILESP